MDASILKKVVLGIQIVAFVGQLVALASPFWLTYKQTLHLGLWQYCSQLNTAGTTLPDWYLAVQGLQSIGFCLALITAILTGVLIIKSQTDPNKKLCLVDTIICFLTGLSILIGVGIFAGKKDEIIGLIHEKSTANFSWAFGVSAGSSFLNIVSGILLVVVLIKT